jgi:hypothetical protein
MQSRVSMQGVNAGCQCRVAKSPCGMYNAACFPPNGDSSGAWLSPVERTVRDREVEGSNPFAPTEDLNVLMDDSCYHP